MNEPRPTEEQRLLLELAEGSPVTILMDSRPAGGPTAHGYALRAVDVAPEALNFALFVPCAAPLVGGLEVSRYDDPPTLLLVQAPGLAYQVRRGSVRVLATGELLVDAARGASVCFHAQGGFVQTLAATPEGRVLVGMQPAIDGEGFAGLRGFAPTPLLELGPAPPVAELLAAAAPPPWLAALLVELQALPDELGAWVAVGALGRLWPTGVAGARESSGDAPPRRCRRWARELARERVALVEEAAERRAELLLEDLADLADSGGAFAEGAPAFIEARDDLESLLWLLAQARAGRALGRRLAELDQAARAHGARWLEVELAAQPRWDAVRLGEPDAWWADLALPGSSR